MSPKSIKQSRSVIDVFMMTLWLVMILFFATAFLVRGGPVEDINILPIMVLVSLGLLIILVYNVLVERAVTRRREQMALYAAKHMVAKGKEHGNFGFSLASLDEKEGARNISFDNVIQDKDWAYADFSYDIMKKTKYGEYRAITVYYSVMTTRLPRRLPHVFFDSIKSRRRQFRSFFSSAQIQKLEGDFDKHFVTYFPQTYHIDGRSFISPEVMWAIREANDYDIEIIGDQLFLFGDLRDPQAQIPEMVSRITEIKKKLLNNVVTYRDEAVPYAVGRQGVSELGAQLAQNLTGAYISLTLGLILTAAAIALIILEETMIIYLLIIGVSLFGTSSRKIYQEHKRRKRALNAYRSSIVR